MSKDFVSFPEGYGEEFVSYDRPKFMAFREGSPTIVRVLDETAHMVIRHWIRTSSRSYSVMCLEDQCPICIRNKEIRESYPDNFRDIKGYIPKQYRWMVNVLDRTPVIVDPETNEEYYGNVVGREVKFPTVTQDGQRSLVGIEPCPSNTIKILERGKRLFEQLKTYHLESLVVDEESGEESGGIQTFDLKFITLGSGPKMTITINPLYQRNDDITTILEAGELNKYILSSVGIQLTPEEVERAVKGETLRDIFAARRAQDEVEVTAELQGALADATESLVGDLFKSETTEG